MLSREIRVVVSKRFPRRFLSSAVGVEQRKHHHERLRLLFSQPEKTDSSRLASQSFRCPLVGLRLFMEDLAGSAQVVTRAAAGYRLDNSEKAMVQRTAYDCLKFASLSTFFVIPFAQILIPVVAVKFPRMVPSSFLETGCCAASLEIAQKEQQRLARDFHQQIQDVKISDLRKDAKFPDAKEILTFQKGQARTLRLNAMSNRQLQSLAQLLGVKPTNTTGLLKWRLRHCMRRIRNEDCNHVWEGVDQLSKLELAEACQKRAIPFHGLTETEMQKHLERWARLSSKRDVSMCLLLWIQSSFNLNCRSSLIQPDIYRTDLEEALSLRRDISRQQFQISEQQKKLEKRQMTKADEIQAQIDEIVDSLLKESRHLEGLLTREYSRSAASSRNSSSHVHL